jgi:predicted DNA-binding protein
MNMVLSIRLGPILESRVEQESRRLGISKSDLVKEALEAWLGLKNPHDLLLQVQSRQPMGRRSASENTGEGLKGKLRAPSRRA